MCSKTGKTLKKHGFDVDIAHIVNPYGGGTIRAYNRNGQLRTIGGHHRAVRIMKDGKIFYIDAIVHNRAGKGVAVDAETYWSYFEYPDGQGVVGIIQVP